MGVLFFRPTDVYAAYWTPYFI